MVKINLSSNETIDISPEIFGVKKKIVDNPTKFDNFMKKHPEKLKIFRRAQANFIKNAFYKPWFHCKGENYNSIYEISYNSEVAAYHEKIKSMKFSDGQYLNIERSTFYAKLCYAFECHLDNIEKAYLDCKGINSETGKPFECNMKIEYRTSERYKKRNIARTYSLMDEIKKLDDENRKVTLVTFTTYQKDEDGKGIDYIKQGQDLIRYTQRLHENIRKDYPGVPYVHVIESHKSGYIHIHRVYGCSISKEDQEKYRRLWESYGIGSYKNGLDFAYNEYEDYEKKDYEDYENAFLYQIKYISKSISQDGSYPFHQFLSDAVIWYVSKRTIEQHKGIRSFYISPKWNELIKDKFAKKESVVIWESIILHYCDKEIDILQLKNIESNGIPEVSDSVNEMISAGKTPIELSF